MTSPVIIRPRKPRGSALLRVPVLELLGRSPGLTGKEIALRLDVRYTSTLRAVLGRMVDDGLLHQRRGDWGYFRSEGQP